MQKELFPHYELQKRYEECFNVVKDLEGLLRDICINHANVKEVKLKKKSHKLYDWYRAYIKRRTRYGIWLELFYPDFPNILKTIQDKELYHRLRGYPRKKNETLEDIEKINDDFCKKYKDKIEEIIKFIREIFPKFLDKKYRSELALIIYYVYVNIRNSYSNIKLDLKNDLSSLTILCPDRYIRIIITKEIKRLLEKAKSKLICHEWIPLESNDHTIIVSI